MKKGEKEKLAWSWTGKKQEHVWVYVCVYATQPEC